LIGPPADGGAGEAEVVVGAGLAETAGGSLGAGEALLVDGLERIIGLGVERRMASSLAPLILNLTSFLGRCTPSLGVCSRGRLGGFIAPEPLLKDKRTGGGFGLDTGAGAGAGAGTGVGAGDGDGLAVASFRVDGAATAGAFCWVLSLALMGFVRTLSVFWKCRRPYYIQSIRVNPK
jgi:hypothetical protein